MSLLRVLPAWQRWLGAALILGFLPWLADSRVALGLLSQMGVAVILCLSYWLLMGQGGMLSFGHALFAGAGAFACMHLLRAVEAGAPWPVGLLPLACGLATAALALPLGWLSTRQGSTAFAMITLGLGELAWAVALMFPGAFGGEAGITGNRSAGPALGFWTLGPAWQVYALIAVHAWASALLIHGYTQTPAGRLLNAVRDNPLRVDFVGHDPRRVRLQAFVVASFFAGVSGALGALLHEIVSAELFGSQRSATVLVFTVLGGVGCFLGPLLGGVFMVLGSVWLSGWTPGWLLYLGLAFMAVLLVAPGGVAGWLMAPGRVSARPWPQRLQAGGGLALALLGVVAAVEMAYQLRWSDTLGTQRRLAFGWVLDAGQPWHWAMALAAAVLGAGLAWRARSSA